MLPPRKQAHARDAALQPPPPGSAPCPPVPPPDGLPPVETSKIRGTAQPRRPRVGKAYQAVLPDLGTDQD